MQEQLISRLAECDHSNTALQIAVDVRTFFPIGTPQEFRNVRDGVFDFWPVADLFEIVWLIRQSHECSLSDAVSVPNGLFKVRVNELMQNPRCTCQNCCKDLFTVSDLAHAGTPLRDLFLVNIICGNAQVNDYNQAAQAWLARTQFGQNPGQIIKKTLCTIVIGGSPNLMTVGTHGLVFHFASPAVFRTTVTGLDFKLPGNHLVVSKTRIGSSYIRLAFTFSRPLEVDHYEIQMMAYPDGTAWIDMGSTQNQTFTINSVSALKVRPRSAYRVRVRAVLKSNKKLDYVEPQAMPDEYPYATIPESEMFKLMKTPDGMSEEENELRVRDLNETLRKRLDQPLCGAASKLGVKKYRFVVMGDVGAGKSR